MRAQPPATAASSQRRPLKQEDALEYLNHVKRQFGDNPKVYNQFLDIMRMFKSHTIDTTGVIARVKDLFRGHTSLIMGFNTFLPADYRISIAEAQPVVRRAHPEFDHAYSYVSKIKARFATQPHIYREFLDILHRYQREVRSISQVKGHVAKLFRHHPDLLVEFGDFLPASRQAKSRQQTSKRTRAPSPPKDKKGGGKETGFFDRIKKRLSQASQYGRETYTDFLKLLQLFTQDVLTKAELVQLVEEALAPHDDLIEEFKEYVGVKQQQSEERFEPDFSVPRATAELDFTNCKQSGDSYKRLPESYEQPICSGRHELCVEVLNDKWVSVPSGSEDYSFKHFRKNQYEESLFKCEDDRFELDMIIEANLSTIRQIAPLIPELERMSSTARNSWKLPSTFRVFHTRAIERVYGDHGSEVLEFLYRTPGAALPIILPRLQQKDEEWRRARRDMNKIWREVYEKNYHKSLDHRSFYFKQVDKKRLGVKALVAEIKEATGEQGAGVMTLRMDDESMHSDVWRVICIGANETMSRKERSRLVKLWTAYLLPIMGIPASAIDNLEIKPKPKGKGKDADKDADDGQEPSVMGSLIEAAEQGGPAESAGGERGEGEEEANGDDGENRNSSDSEEDDDDGGIFDSVNAEHFAKFRPLNTHAEEDAATALSGLDTSVDRSLDKSMDDADAPERRIFFGNTGFYTFFRFYDILYQRLQQARELSSKVSAKGKDKDKGKEKKKDEAEEGKGSERSETYERFFQLFDQLFDGTIDNGKFEDECRMLLGTQSYELYTLDKVVEKLLSQVHALTSDTVSHKLLLLSAYEHLRIGGLDKSLYRANALAAVGDDNCFRMEFSGLGALRIEALEQAVGSGGNSGGDVKSRQQERNKQRLLDSLVQPVLFDDPTQLPRHESFLLRNVRTRPLAEAVKGTLFKNGLEFQIGTDTELLEYFPFTSDVFFRPASARPGGARRENARRARWRDWHAKRFQQVVEAPPPADDDDDDDESASSKSDDDEERDEAGGEVEEVEEEEVEEDERDDVEQMDEDDAPAQPDPDQGLRDDVTMAEAEVEREEAPEVADEEPKKEEEPAPEPVTASQEEPKEEAPVESSSGRPQRRRPGRPARKVATRSGR